MKKTAIKRAIIILLSLITVAVLLSTFVSADDSGITFNKVEISREKDTLKLDVSVDSELVEKHKGKDLYLFELRPENTSEDLTSITPMLIGQINKKVVENLEFTKAKLYSSYVVAVKADDGSFIPLSERAYITNPEVLAENTSPFPEKSTKKGLVTQIGSDAQYLGAAHTTISIDLNEYMAASYRENSIAYINGGQTFYFPLDKINALDHKIKVLTESGINVYLNIVLGKDNGSGLSSVFPLCAGSEASYYAINTDTVSSVKYYTAFCEFITSRYSKDSSRGFVPGYILGYEVDSVNWNYAGDIPFDKYVQSFENAYRILYSAARSTHSDSRVFVSVSNIFNTSDDTPNSYGYKVFLDSFAKSVRTGGDIEWSLAVNPYPSDFSNTEFWADERATDSPDTEFLTVKNLNVLSDYMNTSPLLYGGHTRNIIIAEFGLNGNFDDAKNNDCQAAAYALAYAIVDKNPDIDAFIYYRQIDYPAETAKFGLWTSIASGTLSPVNRKSIYNIFKYADTDDYSEGLNMAKAFCPAELYDEYVKDYSPTSRRITYESIPIVKSDIRPTFKETTLFDLSLGSADRFYPANSCSYVELRQVSADSAETRLFARMNPVSGNTYMGISRMLDENKRIDGSFLCLRFRAVTPQTETVNVMLRLDGFENGIPAVYEGVVQTNSNEECELSFKIADFVKKTDGDIRSIKLWFKPSSGALTDGEYGLWLESISLHKKTGLDLFVTVFVSFIIIAVVAAIIILVVLVSKNREINSKIKGFFGKKRFQLIGFLKNKKIISRRHTRRKGARQTPPKAQTQSSSQRAVRDTDIKRRPAPVNSQKRPGIASQPHQNLQKRDSGTKPQTENSTDFAE